MATYDYTSGGSTKLSQTWYGKHFVAKLNINTEDIIASDATLTANAKITAADIIQMIDWPARFVITGMAFRTVTPGTAANTMDIGLAGGQELAAGTALDAAAGTIALLAVAASYGPDNVTGVVYTATDTIDVQFIADETTGEWDLYLEGWEVW